MDNAESEKLDIRIDRFLAGEMTSPERDQFEAEMKAEPGLSRKVSLRKKMTDFFRRDGDQLLQKLEQAGEKHIVPANNQSNKTWIIGLVVLLIIATSLVIINKNNSPQQQDNAPTPVIDTLRSSEGKATENNVDTTQNLPPPPPRDEPLQKPPAEVGPKPTPAPPIAALDPADYIANAYLEAILTDQLRSDFQIAIESPATNDTLLIRERDQWYIQVESNQDVGLTYVIYDNDEERFLNEESSASGTLKVMADEVAFTFNTIITTALKPGRYYLLIMSEPTGELLASQRFFVK